MNIGTAVAKAIIETKAEPELKKLAKAAEGVETMFIKDLLNVMRKSLPKEAQSMPGKDIYYDMLDQALAEGMAKNSSFGVSKMMLDTMKPAILRLEAQKLGLNNVNDLLKGVEQIGVKANAAVRELMDKADKQAELKIKISVGGHKTEN